MMDVREKLVEQLLWWSNECDRTNFGCQARKLLVEAANYISSGVTVQEWVSVDDRLPNPIENAICINRRGDMMIGTYTEWGWMFPSFFEDPTHWMPLPQPPKGE